MPSFITFQPMILLVPHKSVFLSDIIPLLSRL